MEHQTWEQIMARFPITQADPLKQQFLHHIWASTEKNPSVRETLLAELQIENIPLTVGARLLAINKFDASGHFSVAIVHDECPITPISFGEITRAIADDVIRELQARNHLAECDVVGRDIFISSFPIPDDSGIGGFAPVGSPPATIISHPVEVSSADQRSDFVPRNDLNYQLRPEVLAVIRREMGNMPANPPYYLMHVEEMLGQKIQNTQNEIASLEQMESELVDEEVPQLIEQLVAQRHLLITTTHDRELVHQAIMDLPSGVVV